ncbi:hypothetical protein ABLE91_14610 [Aquabacter sp. CN5-332]|uniref:hypothetical protein n=1 Tax=Aquabacter sp. CN5-332 TaxID=3156608 RepID=UPI0032B4C433
MPDTPGTTSTALRKLDELCRQIARGNYHQSDELFALTGAEDAPEMVRDLAESFGFMLVSVEAREMRLTQLVEELKGVQAQLEEANGRLARENENLSSTVAQLTVEIDRQRFKREVGAITESDYFQDIQRRARSLREKHKPTGPGGRE